MCGKKMGGTLSLFQCVTVLWMFMHHVDLSEENRTVCFIIGILFLFAWSVLALADLLLDLSLEEKIQQKLFCNYE